MAAVFSVDLDVGGSDGTPGAPIQTIANLRFNVADDNDQDTGNPIPIPSGADNYSYWKQVYLRCTTAPDTECNNFEFYSDGVAWDTGVDIMVATNEVTNDADYNIADGAVEMVANHTGVDASASINDYTSGGSQLALGVVPGDDIIDATSEETEYLVFQMDISNTAGPGQVTSKDLTVSYDEI